MASFVPISRRIALRIATPSLFCRQCLSKPSFRTHSRVLQALTATETPAPSTARYFSNTRAIREANSSINTAQTVVVQAKSNTEKANAESGGSRAGKGRPKFTESKAVAIWLLGSAASVFGIVVFGGLTRLTESGLSITEWKPITGSLPPTTAASWESEFEKYRASPEFALLNPLMTLDEFKKIYFMEWAHRVWGRFICVSFVLPAVYFAARRRVSAPMAWNLAGISVLIGFQGVVGWWMVKSGLKDDLFAPGSHPRVSQYRLTAHLATAFVAYGWMLMSGLKVLRNRSSLKDPAGVLAAAPGLSTPVMRRFRVMIAALTTLVFATAMSGALVAGLDAGLIYNEFPKMGVGLAPPSSELWNEFYSRREDRSDLWWRNMLENPSTVQLQHRILATASLCAVLAFAAYTRTGARKAALPRSVRKGATGIVHLMLMQVTLGISTLIYMVPVWLGALHQAGSLLVLTGALVLVHRARAPSARMLSHLRAASQVQRSVSQPAQAVASRASKTAKAT